MSKTKYLSMDDVESALKQALDLAEDESIVFVQGHRNGPNSVQVRIEE